MAQLFDENGNLVEAFTEEEVQIKIQEQTEKLIEETNATRQEEIDEIQKELEKTQEDKRIIEAKLIGETDKDKNFKNLRNQTELKEAVILDLKKQIEDLQKTTDEKLTQISGSFQTEKTSRMILDLASGNKELSDKIEVNFKKFGIPKDEADLKQKLSDAYILTTGNTEKKSFLSGNIISAGGTKIGLEEGKKLDEETGGVAKKLGISDQELKRHKLI